jgi:hypothetical protein
VRRLLLLAAFVAITFSANAATYYVDCASAGGDGTTTATSGAAAAYATVAAANGRTFSAGDSLLFKRGCTWTGTRLTMDESGSAGNPITIGAYGSGAAPVLSGGGTANYCIYTVAANYVTVDGITTTAPTAAGYLGSGTNQTIRNFTHLSGGTSGITTFGNSGGRYENISVTGHTGIGITHTTASSDVAMENVTVLGSPGTAVYFANVSGLSITGVTATAGGANNTHYGIYVLDSSDVSISRCVASGRTADGIRTKGVTTATIADCVSSGNATNGFTLNFANSDVTVERCTAHGNTNDGFSANGTGTGNVFRRNRSFDNGGADNASGDGFTSHDSVGVSFHYNAAWNNFKSGIAIVGTGSGAIYNNTFYNNYEATNNTDWGIFISGTGAWDVKNNITANHTHEVWIETGADTVTSNNNVFYPSRGASAFYYHGTTYTFADYKTASSQDANSLSGDPRLLAPAAADFRLQGASPARNAGTDLGFTSDIVGAPIVGTPDIGAYEHDSRPRLVLP